MRRAPSFSPAALPLFLGVLASTPSAVLAQTVKPQPAPPLLDSGQIASALFQGLWVAVSSFWYVWLLIAVIGLGRLYLAHQRQAALAEAGIDTIDVMDGRTFEECLAAVFRRLGYTVELTPYAGDWGGDLVLAKEGVKTVVQAKRYKKAVGVRAVQEAVAAKAKYGCSEAMVVTNSVYTKQAEELARANGVTLWDRQRLVQALLSAKKEPGTGSNTGSTAGSLDLATAATASPTTTPLSTEQTCALCSKPVSEKVAAFCQANPSRFGGRLYCFEHQKQAARQEHKNHSIR